MYQLSEHVDGLICPNMILFMAISEKTTHKIDEENHGTLRFF